MMLTTGYMNCDCQIKDEAAEIGSEIASKILSIMTSINVDIVKCYDIVFTYVSYYLNIKTIILYYFNTCLILFLN